MHPREGSAAKTKHWAHPLVQSRLWRDRTHTICCLGLWVCERLNLFLNFIFFLSPFLPLLLCFQVRIHRRKVRRPNSNPQSFNINKCFNCGKIVPFILANPRNCCKKCDMRMIKARSSFRSCVCEEPNIVSEYGPHTNAWEVSRGIDKPHYKKLPVVGLSRTRFLYSIQGGLIAELISLPSLSSHSPTHKWIKAQGT